MNIEVIFCGEGNQHTAERVNTRYPLYWTFVTSKLSFSISAAKGVHEQSFFNIWQLAPASVCTVYAQGWATTIVGRVVKMSIQMYRSSFGQSIKWNTWWFTFATNPKHFWTILSVSGTTGNLPGAEERRENLPYKYEGIHKVWAHASEGIIQGRLREFYSIKSAASSYNFMYIHYGHHAPFINNTFLKG